MNELKIKLYNKALDKWGVQFQLILLMEESAELQQATSKFIRGKDNIINLIEEMADVEIMIEQLKIILAREQNLPIDKVKLQVTTMKQLKLKRLEEMLK